MLLYDRNSEIDRKQEMMSYQEFEEIERMHSFWSMIDKVARMAYLKRGRRSDWMKWLIGMDCIFGVKAA